MNLLFVISRLSIRMEVQNEPLQDDASLFQKGPPNHGGSGRVPPAWRNNKYQLGIRWQIMFGVTYGNVTPSLVKKTPLLQANSGLLKHCDFIRVPHILRPFWSLETFFGWWNWLSFVLRLQIFDTERLLSKVEKPPNALHGFFKRKRS